MPQTRHDSPSPRRTGRADFPHPALTKTVVRRLRPATKRRLRPRIKSSVSVESVCSGSSLPRAAVRSSVDGFPQAALPPSDENASSFRPLRSTVVTRFFATMGLSDSRTGSPRGYVFPQDVGPTCSHPAGPPRFLDRSVPTRRPLSPRRAQQVLAPIASLPVSGFRFSGRLAALTLRNEAEPGSLTLRLAGSPHEASPAGSLRPALDWLPVEWAIDRSNSFQFDRSARLVLAHQRPQRSPCVGFSVFSASLW